MQDRINMVLHCNNSVNINEFFLQQKLRFKGFYI